MADPTARWQLVDWWGCILLSSCGGTIFFNTLFANYHFLGLQLEITFIRLPFCGANICVGGGGGGGRASKAVCERLRKFSALLKKQPVKVRLAMLLLFSYAPGNSWNFTLAFLNGVPCNIAYSVWDALFLDHGLAAISCRVVFQIIFFKLNLHVSHVWGEVIHRYQGWDSFGTLVKQGTRHRLCSYDNLLRLIIVLCSEALLLCKQVTLGVVSS